MISWLLELEYNYSQTQTVVLSPTVVGSSFSTVSKSSSQYSVAVPSVTCDVELLVVRVLQFLQSSVHETVIADTKRNAIKIKLNFFIVVFFCKFMNLTNTEIKNL